MQRTNRERLSLFFDLHALVALVLIILPATTQAREPPTVPVVTGLDHIPTENIIVPQGESP